MEIWRQQCAGQLTSLRRLFAALKQHRTRLFAENARADLKVFVELQKGLRAAAGGHGGVLFHVASGIGKGFVTQLAGLGQSKQLGFGFVQFGFRFWFHGVKMVLSADASRGC